MTNYILLVASPRAAVLGGIVPLIIMAGLLLIVLAAPASKERIAETLDMLRNLTGQRPLTPVEEDETDSESRSGDWSASTADQYKEFYGLIADDRRDPDQ